MSAKSNKIELREEFMVMWREERPFGMSCPLRIETKMKKTKVSEAAIRGVLVFFKKGGLRNFANSQKNICARVSFLIKLQASHNF